MPAHRVFMNVPPHAFILPVITNAMLVVTGLPHGLQFQTGLSGRVRKAVLDYLHRSSDCMIIVDAQQQMHVIRHDDEFVQEEFTFVAITYDRGQ
jgi:hypothetical protein